MFFLSWLNESVLANATNSPGWIEIIESILAALQKQEGYGMAERRKPQSEETSRTLQLRKFEIPKEEI